MPQLNHEQHQTSRTRLVFNPLKRQPRKMVKHTQTIRRQFPDELLSVFDHFVRLALKGLRIELDH